MFNVYAVSNENSILKKALFPFSKILNHHFNQYLYSKQDINSKFKPFVLLAQNFPKYRVKHAGARSGMVKKRLKSLKKFLENR